MPGLPIDADRLQQQIDALAEISEVPAPAVTRVIFSPQDMQAREFLKRLIREAGLDLREDGAGNIFARWNGSRPELPAIASGSHTDAIPNAGRYDGVVGVLGVLEAIRALKQAGFTPKRSLELIAFTSEEPTRFGVGCLGSRLMAGSLTLEKLHNLRDAHDRTFEELRTAAGYTANLDDVRLATGAYAGFIELHIEQGPILESENTPIGIVERIAAPSSLRVTVVGVGGHAGAVLMLERRDALLAGAAIALAVEAAVRASGRVDTVGTTGVFRIEPGAVNSIPHRAILEIDLRDTDLTARDETLERIREAIAEITRRRGVSAKVEIINADPPAQCETRLVQCVEDVCIELGLRARRMVSRAYHDSLFMAQLCPITMIFIPCRDGVSHRPDEYSSPEQIRTGVEVLAHALQRLSADVD